MPTDLHDHLREQLRRQKPGLAQKATRQRGAAIRLFCLECMGGNAAEVRRCDSIRCFLHPYRMGRREDVSLHAPDGDGNTGAENAQ